MSRPDAKGGYERRDASRGLVAVMGIGMVVLTVAAILLMRTMLDVLEKGEVRRQPEPISLAAGDNATEPPAPRLEANPGANLAALHHREQQTLTGYGWVDQENGVVRIPIQRAMELIAERGLPVYTGDEVQP